jgi:hypothetical protein
VNHWVKSAPSATRLSHAVKSVRGRSKINRLHLRGCEALLNNLGHDHAPKFDCIHFAFMSLNSN